MSGVLIKYGGVAEGAKEDFTASASEQMPFIDLANLQNAQIVKNYGNPCELYSVALDNKTLPLPEHPERIDLGYWSEQISGEDGAFDTPITLTFIAEHLYTTTSITLMFDADSNIYPKSIKLEWYRDSTLLQEQMFEPNNAFYSFEQKVEFFNKLIITVYSINMPFNRFKLRDISYGSNVEFKGTDIKSVSLSQTVDPISKKLEVNTADIVIDPKIDKDYVFQKRQPLMIEFDNELKATVFVSSAKQTSKTAWRISAEDYIGVMGGVDFFGGIYNSKNAVELLEEIFAKSKVPFNIEGLGEKTVTGYLPYTSCREALKQVCFAVGAVVNTANSSVVNVYIPSDEVSQTIPPERIKLGVSYEEESRVTAVEVLAHKYTPISEELTAYDASESGSGNNIFVKFNQPLHTLSITGGSIVESGANYAIINATSTAVLKGQKYEHRVFKKSKTNPLVLASDADNVLSVENATLVSSENVDNVLDMCYNELTKANSVNLQVVEAKHIRGAKIVRYGELMYGEFKYRRIMPMSVEYDERTSVGDLITVTSGFKGDTTGRIIKQTFSLNGGNVVKDTVMR